MIIIDCEGKKIDNCLKKYRQKLDKIGQTSELRNRKVYVKPSVKRRRVLLEAKYRKKMYGAS